MELIPRGGECPFIPVPPRPQPSRRGGNLSPWGRFEMQTVQQSLLSESVLLQSRRDRRSPAGAGRQRITSRTACKSCGIFHQITNEEIKLAVGHPWGESDILNWGSKGQRAKVGRLSIKLHFPSQLNLSKRETLCSKTLVPPRSSQVVGSGQKPTTTCSGD